MPDRQTALFYQPSSGLSGDMHLAALVDLGVPEDWLRSQLNKLPISGEYSLALTTASKMGITGTRCQVNARDAHDHRHHSTIVKMIRAAAFAPGIEQRALGIFQKLAEAEGKIHNVAPEQVHFHEVGAADSIIDIVAAALCIEHFAPDIVICNPVEVGSGFVNCAHGRFPVPAPATQELLANAPCTYGTVSGESTTPTGAAILAASVNEFSPQGTFTPEKIGYGIGHKDFEVPNVLRVALGHYEALGRSSRATTQHYKIEANIDDMSPEGYAPLIDSLFKAGAVDVYLQPILMKKNRPAHILVALCHAADKDHIADTLLNSSTTIGLRILGFEKRVLPREELTLTTRLGDVRVKRVTQPNGQQRWKSEYEDVLACAMAAEVDYAHAKAVIDFDIHQQLDNQ
ncbi:MAG: nickel pincer cofactor biosynthesis protein LarC [bacterium]